MDAPNASLQLQGDQQMSTYHEFNHSKINESLEAAQSHFDIEALTKANAETNLAEGGCLTLRAECVSVDVEDNKVCLKLPLGIGNSCIPLPISIPNGTAARACLYICTTFGVPTGVKVTVSVLDEVVAKKSFGKC
jgi:hypothetical protein